MDIDNIRLSDYIHNLDIIKYLVEKGANIHAQDDEALRWAAINGHLPVVQYLVEHGANIHAENDVILRWLLYSARRWDVRDKYKNVVEYLINITNK